MWVLGGVETDKGSWEAKRNRVLQEKRAIWKRMRWVTPARCPRKKWLFAGEVMWTPPVRIVLFSPQSVGEEGSFRARKGVVAGAADERARVENSRMRSQDDEDILLSGVDRPVCEIEDATRMGRSETAAPEDLDKFEPCDRTTPSNGLNRARTATAEISERTATASQDDSRNESQNRCDDEGLGKRSAVEDRQLPAARAADGNVEQLAAAVEGANSRRMKSRVAEASLADLRGSLADVLVLSFRCGEEHAARQHVLENQSHRNNVNATTRDDISGQTAVAVLAGKKWKDGDDIAGDDSRLTRNMPNDSSEHPDGEKKEHQGSWNSASPLPSLLANDGGLERLGAGDARSLMAAAAGVEDMEDDNKQQDGVPDDRVCKAGTWWCGGGCESCETRAKAVHELLSR